MTGAAPAAAPPPGGKSIFDDDWKPPPATAPPAPPASAPAAPEPAPRIRPRARPPADAGKGEVQPPAPPPVPSAAALAPAEQLVKETFKAEYARTSAADRAALARALLREVPENLTDAPALYVMLREARDLATAAGDVESAVTASRGLRDAFRMDAAAAKEMERSAMVSAAGAMATAPAAVATPAAARRAAELLLMVAERDLRAGEYAAAAQAAAQAEVAARRAINVDLLTRLRGRVLALQAIAAEYEQVKPALATLKTNPSDPAACLAAGRFYACLLDNPDRGLPLLAKCADPAVKAAAAKDGTIASAAAPADQAALADAWANAARAQPAAAALARDWMQRRALKWYDAALVKLEGPTRAATEKRAKDLRMSRVRRGGLAGEYFLGRQFGLKIFTRVDPKIEFQWKGQPPDDALSAEDFSARWTGWVKSPAAGQYKLIVVHDDAVRVWLDGVLLIDKWGPHMGRNGEVAQFTGALQELKVEYAQFTGSSHMALGWRPADVTDWRKTKPLLPENLYHDPPPPGPLFPQGPGPSPGGKVELTANHVRMNGGGRYVNGHVGHWHKLDAWMGWDFEAPAGLYDVDVVYACGANMAGSEYAVSVGNARLPGTVTDTGGWDRYRPHRLGRVRLGGGAHALRVTPVSRPRQAIMDLGRVVLTPVGEGNHSAGNHSAGTGG